MKLTIHQPIYPQGKGQDNQTMLMEESFSSGFWLCNGGQFPLYQSFGGTRHLLTHGLLVEYFTLLPQTPGSSTQQRQ